MNARLNVLQAERSPVFKRAFEHVVHAIRDSIARGELKVGDRLDGERELAEHFGVSRSTVREAIRSLESSGLLILKRGPGGGAFVASGDGGVVRTGMTDLISLGLIEPHNLREAQAVICVAVVRLAAKRRTSGDLEAIRATIAATAAAARNKNVPERVSLNYEFHRLLARATRNPALEVLTNAVLELNDSLGKVAGVRSPRPGMSFRYRIFEHLENRDAEAAAAEMEQHLQRIQRFYRSRLRSTGA